MRTFMGLPNTKGLPNAAIVGAPEIRVFTSREAQESVQGPAGLEIVGCDVVEVYPAYDHAQIKALLAANVVHKFLSLLALSKKTGSM